MDSRCKKHPSYKAKSKPRSACDRCWEIYVSDKRIEIKSECSSCGGTGLYSGFCEAKGEAVVCLTCSGSGCEVIRYKPFSGRRAKRGIKSVRISRGSFIATGVGGYGDTMTYKEFEGRFK